jgi:hypothetical protein
LPLLPSVGEVFGMCCHSTEYSKFPEVDKHTRSG